MTTVAGVSSGVGGFDRAFHLAGAQILWACEIDRNCQEVLKTRFPGVHCYRDMLDDEILQAPPPDVFVGGTPCQGFSVAGLRKGLNDDRSNLAIRFIELCDHFNPNLILWENVPGVLSDKDNAFGCFLAGLVGADAALVPPIQCGGRWTNAGVVAGPKRTAAWRVLDSQYFGVAQRRERVFVVASPRAELPFQVLFEPEGLRRHSPPSREAGQGFAADVAPSLTSSGRGVERPGESRGQDPVVAVHAFGGNNTGGTIDVATACNAHGGTGRCDFESETFVAHALRADGFDVSEDGMGRGTPIVPVAYRTSGNCGVMTQGDRTAAINCGTDPNQQIVAFQEAHRQGYAVRRLTPTECERLQAFPDGWTAVTNTKGKPMADGPRYKMMGNAVTVNVVEWLARRILKSLTLR